MSASAHSASSSDTSGLLYLAQHIFCCAVSGALVFLDIRQERYFALEPVEAQSLSSAVAGFSSYFAASPSGSTVPAHSFLLHQLIAAGVLTASSTEGKVGEPLCVMCRGSLLCRALDEPATRSRRHKLVFAKAVLATRHALAQGGVHRAISSFQSLIDHGNASSIDVLAALSGFLRLRPWFYRADGACLFDSLVLCRYLAELGVPAHLIIGVQLAPFAAHAWTQIGESVANDTSEAVLAYTPLMRA